MRKTDLHDSTTRTDGNKNKQWYTDSYKRSSVGPDVLKFPHLDIIYILTKVTNPNERAELFHSMASLHTALNKATLGVKARFHCWMWKFAELCSLRQQTRKIIISFSFLEVQRSSFSHPTPVTTFSWELLLFMRTPSIHLGKNSLHFFFFFF